MAADKEKPAKTYREWADMKGRYARLGKKEHFASLRPCKSEFREIDWYALAQKRKKDNDLRTMKAKRLADIRRANLHWERVVGE